MIKFQIGQRAILAALLLGWADPNASNANGIEAPLPQRIEAAIFDAPLREACLHLLESITSAKSARFDFDQATRQAQSIYLHARRYRNMYGDRRWQTAGSLVSEVLVLADSKFAQADAPDYARSTITRYRLSLARPPELTR